MSSCHRFGRPVAVDVVPVPRLRPWPPVPRSRSLLERDGSALPVHRHPARPHYPDCWDLVGGHVGRGETPQDAVIRDGREEIDVLVRDPAPIRLVRDDASLDVHASLVARRNGVPVNAAPDEDDDLRWCRPDQLDSLPHAHDSSRPSIRAAARQAAER